MLDYLDGVKSLFEIADKQIERATESENSAYQLDLVLAGGNEYSKAFQKYNHSQILIKKTQDIVDNRNQAIASVKTNLDVGIDAIQHLVALSSQSDN